MKNRSGFEFSETLRDELYYLMAKHDIPPYDAEEYIQKLADSEDRYNRTSTFETGTGVKWAQYSYEGADYDFYYRAKDFDDNVVLVKYLVHENAPEGKCELHLENIMTSINKK